MKLKDMLRYTYIGAINILMLVCVIGLLYMIKDDPTFLIIILVGCFICMGIGKLTDYIRKW